MERYYAVVAQISGGMGTPNDYIVKLYNDDGAAVEVATLLRHLHRIYLSIEDVELNERHHMYEMFTPEIQLYKLEDVVKRMFDNEEEIYDIQVMPVSPY